MSKLVDMFLGTIGKPSLVAINVPEFGRVGVRTSMLLGERSSFFADRTAETANALLLQKTVCDPETGDLVLASLSLDQINSFPTHIVDPLLDSAFLAIGIKNEGKTEGEELKNSETDQN